MPTFAHNFSCTLKSRDFRLKSPILAPPLTDCYGLLGTAFDYLLRFYVEKLNPGAKLDWVGDQGLALSTPSHR